MYYFFPLAPMNLLDPPDTSCFWPYSFDFYTFHGVFKHYLLDLLDFFLLLLDLLTGFS